MRKLISLLIVLLLCSCSFSQEDAVSMFAVGNEYQVGGGFLLNNTGVTHTAAGLDARWIDDGLDTWQATFCVMWQAVPEIQLPVGGMFPQASLPVPESIPASLNLGGRIGYYKENETKEDGAVAVLLVEAEVFPQEKASLAIRYEYAFTDGWDQLQSDAKEHQAFLNLKYRF